MIQYAEGPSIKICTTISPIYSITADVVSTREKIAVVQMFPSAKNIEDYKMGEAEYTYYSNFDLVIINGMGLDNEIAERLKNINPNIKICDASLGIDPIIDENGEKNKKIWSSPLNQLIMYQNIANAIMEIDKMPLVVTKENEQPNEATIKQNKTITNNNEAIVKEYKTRFLYFEDLLKNDITVEKSIAPKADLQNLQSNKEKNKKETVQGSKEEKTNIDKLQITEETKKEILDQIKIKTSKKAIVKDDSFDYLLKDCSIEKAQSKENSIEIGNFETDSDSNNKCLLKDIAKQEEIMPNTDEETVKYNMKKLKFYFGENKK